MACPCLSWCPYIRVVVTWQLDWSVQAAQLTPYLLVVGVPYQYYTLACLCGPISGLIVQPLMGVFSDHCHSRLGRRRPFIIAGVLLIVFGLMLIANSSYIGRTLWGSKYGVATDSQRSHSIRSDSTVTTCLLQDSPGQPVPATIHISAPAADC